MFFFPYHIPYSPFQEVGYTTPSGSYLRSASVVKATSASLDTNGINQIEVSGSPDFINVGIGTRLMVYSTGSNITKYVVAQDIDPDDHFIVNIVSSSLIPITNNYFAMPNDDLDLFAINGHIQIEIESDNNQFEFRQLPQLFLNDGNAVFTLFDNEKNNAFNEPIVGRGGAFADYDKDGDIDILLTENSGGIHLWRNDLINDVTPNYDLNYIRIKLIGDNSNRNGIGSLLNLYIDGKKISRRVKTGSSYLSQSEKIITFGLGELNQIDSLEVEWSSGKRTALYDFDLNKEIEILE